MSPGSDPVTPFRCTVAGFPVPDLDHLALKPGIRCVFAAPRRPRESPTSCAASSPTPSVRGRRKGCCLTRSLEVVDVERDHHEEDFVRTAIGVLKAIDAGVSYPVRGWACKTCQWAHAASRSTGVARIAARRSLSPLLPLVLGLRGFLRVPLLDGRALRAAALERHDVVDDVAGARAVGLAGRGAGMRLLERLPRFGSRFVLPWLLRWLVPPEWCDVPDWLPVTELFAWECEDVECDFEL